MAGEVTPELDRLVPRGLRCQLRLVSLLKTHLHYGLLLFGLNIDLSFKILFVVQQLIIVLDQLFLNGLLFKGCFIFQVEDTIDCMAIFIQDNSVAHEVWVHVVSLVDEALYRLQVTEEVEEADPLHLVIIIYI